MDNEHSCRDGLATDNKLLSCLKEFKNKYVDCNHYNYNVWPTILADSQLLNRETIVLSLVLIFCQYANNYHHLSFALTLQVVAALYWSAQLLFCTVLNKQWTAVQYCTITVLLYCTIHHQYCNAEHARVWACSAASMFSSYINTATSETQLERNFCC